jgi:uncharacterized protein
MRRLVLCAALLLTFGSAAQAAEPEPKTITVSGAADMLVKPDHATVNIGVDTSNKVTVRALEANTALMQKVLAAIREAGVKDSEIQTANFSISALHPPGRQSYEVDYSVTTGYAVSNTLVVSVSDIAKVGEIIDAAVRSGANTTNSVTFEAKDQKALEDKVLAEAVRNARHNAEVMAAAEGAKVGKVVSMANSASTYRYAAVSNRMAYAAAPVPVMPGEVPVSAEVVVVFALE